MNKYLNSILKWTLVLLGIFIPCREIIAFYTFDYIKLLPDVIILLFLILVIINNKFKLSLKIYDKIYLLFIIIGLISTLINGSSLTAFIIQTRSIVTMYSLFYILRQQKLSISDYKPVVITLLIVSTIITLGGFVEYITGKEYFFITEWISKISKTNINRIYTIIKNPNTYAMFTFLVLLLVYYYCNLIGSKKNCMLFIFTLVSLTGIFLSASRSAFINCFLLFLIFLYELIFKKQSKVFIIYLCSFIISFGLSFGLDYLNQLYEYSSNLNIQKTENVISNNKNSENKGLSFDNNLLIQRWSQASDSQEIENSNFNGRIHHIKLGLKIFKNHVLFGTGFGTYGSAGSKNVTPSFYKKYNLSSNFYSDNEYIKVLVETGIVGTIIFLLWIISLLLHSLNNRYHFFAFISFILMGMFYNITEFQIICFVLYLILSLEREKIITKNDNSKENIMGVDVSVTSYDNLKKSVIDDIKNKRKSFIVAINPEKILKARKDEKLKSLLNSATYQIPDGIGVVYASKLKHGKIESRITGIDSMEMLCEISSKLGYKIFMYGAKEEVILKAKENLELKYPGIKIVGTMNGYEKDNGKIIKAINESKADIIFVAMGSPKQEFWITENINKVCPFIFQGVGGSFDVFSGNIKRAPKWMQKIGMEWFYRLLKEPKRIFRQLKLFKFLFIVLFSKKEVYKNESKN